MTCPNSPDISFEFTNDNEEIFLKIRPRSMEFDRQRGSLDYCKASFSKEVANELRPHYTASKSVLHNPLPVILRIEGEPIYRLLYVPDGVRFTEDEVHIEFHDVQKYLTRGEVDWRQESVTLKEAYRHVFNQRDTSGPKMFEDEINFNPTESAYEELVNYYADPPGIFGSTEPTDRILEMMHDENDEPSTGARENDVDSIEEENVYNIIMSHYSIDFDKITPWEAIQRLNEKFGVTTWVNPKGEFCVGSRSTTGYEHIAAIDDHRVWKMSDYNISPPRDPVIKSVVRGGWAADPNEGALRQASEIMNLNRGTKDFRVEGVAERPNIPFGQEIFHEVESAKKDALQEIARRKMIEKQREQWSGEVEILPEFSGDTITKVRYVAIGDRLVTIPPEDDENENSVCDTNIEEELFDVVGVTHILDEDGTWTVRLQVVPVPDYDLTGEVNKKIQYYDPIDEDTITDDEYEDGETGSEDWWGYW